MASDTTAIASYLHEDFSYGDRQHAQFQQEGFLILDHFLSEAGLHRARANCERMIGQLHPSVTPDRMISVHSQEEWVFDLACEPKLLDVIEKQVGPDIVLWSSHMLCKPPHSGTYVPWHQDAPYWNLSGVHGQGVWITLDDIDHDNGAMAVVPRWHTKGKLPVQDSQIAVGFTQEIRPDALPANVEELKVEYLIRAGQAALHHVMIPHNSPPNVADRWRRVLVLRYIEAGGEFGPNQYTNYRTGEPFAREFLLVRGRDVSGLGLRRSPFD